MNQKLIARTGMRSITRAAVVACLAGVLGSAWAQGDAVKVADAASASDKRSVAAVREDDLQRLQALVIAAIIPQADERMAQSRDGADKWNRVVAGTATSTTLK